MATVQVDKAAKAAIVGLIDNGGATISCLNPNTNQLSWGFVVADSKYGEVASGAAAWEYILETITDFVNRNRAILATTNQYLGVWNGPEDFLFIDVVTVIRDKDEAIALGLRNKQLAIYDIYNDETIELEW